MVHFFSCRRPPGGGLKKLRCPEVNGYLCNCYDAFFFRDLDFFAGIRVDTTACESKTSTSVLPG